MAERGDEVVPIKPFVKPAAHGGEQGHLSLPLSADDNLIAAHVDIKALPAAAAEDRKCCGR